MSHQLTNNMSIAFHVSMKILISILLSFTIFSTTNRRFFFFQNFQMQVLAL